MPLRSAGRAGGCAATSAPAVLRMSGNQDACVRADMENSSCSMLPKIRPRVRFVPRFADEDHRGRHDRRQICIYLHVRAGCGGVSDADGREAKRPGLFCRGSRCAGRDDRVAHRWGSVEAKSASDDPWQRREGGDQSQPSTTGISRSCAPACAARPFTFALVTRATAVTIMALPARM